MVLAVGLSTAFTAEAVRVTATSIPVGLGSLVPLAFGVGVGLIALRTAEAPSRSLLASLLGGIAGLRILMQFFPMGSGIIGRAIPAVLIVVLGVAAFVATATVFGGRIAGISALVGGAIDVSIHSAGLTVDLAWQTSTGAVTGVVLLAAGMVGLALFEQQMEGPPTSRQRIPAAGVAALGPWLLIHVGVTGNVAHAGTLVGGDIVAGALVGLVAQVAALAWITPGRRAPQPALGSALALVALILLDGADGAWAALLLVVAGAGAGVALTGSLERQSSAPFERVVWAAGSVWPVVGAGVWLAIAGNADRWRPTWTFALAGAALVGLAIASMQHNPQESVTWLPPVTVVLPMVAVPLLIMSTAPEIQADPAPPGELLVATYDINDARDLADRISLSALAADITESGADVVALQSVPRGRLDLGSVDALAWLSRRLDMDIVWAPTGDARSGSALLTRVPLVVGESQELAGADGRRLIDVAVPVTEETEVRILAADFAPDVDPVLSATALLDHWDGSPATMVIGSFEVAGTSEPIGALVGAGLFDVASVVAGLDASTFPADGATTRADYIFITGDLRPLGTRVVETATGSDHLPIVARVALAPQTEP